MSERIIRFLRVVRTRVMPIVWVTMIAMFASSCVSTTNIALSSTDRTVMKGKTVAVTQRAMPEHGVLKSSAMTGAMMFGAVGGAIAGNMAVNEGASELSKHHIANPNETLSCAVTKSLVAKISVKTVPGACGKKSLDPKTIAHENSQADYVLDCSTLAWTGIYYPLNFARYQIVYGAKIQLIETSTGRVVATSYSHYQANDSKNAPDYAGIYSNDAAFLKAETKKGTDQAIGEFTKLL